MKLKRKSNETKSQFFEKINEITTSKSYEEREEKNKLSPWKKTDTDITTTL